MQHAEATVVTEQLVQAVLGPPPFGAAAEAAERVQVGQELGFFHRGAYAYVNVLCACVLRVWVWEGEGSAPPLLPSVVYLRAWWVRGGACVVQVGLEGGEWGEGVSLGLWGRRVCTRISALRALLTRAGAGHGNWPGGDGHRRGGPVCGGGVHQQGAEWQVGGSGV